MNLGIQDVPMWLSPWRLQKNYKIVVLYPKGVWKLLSSPLHLCNGANLWWSKGKSYNLLSWGSAYCVSLRLKDPGNSSLAARRLALHWACVGLWTGMGPCFFMEEGCSNLWLWIALFNSPLNMSFSAQASQQINICISVLSALTLLKLLCRYSWALWSLSFPPLDAVQNRGQVQSTAGDARLLPSGVRLCESLQRRLQRRGPGLSPPRSDYPFFISHFTSTISALFSW